MYFIIPSLFFTIGSIVFGAMWLLAPLEFPVRALMLTVSCAVIGLSCAVAAYKTDEHS